METVRTVVACLTATIGMTAMAHRAAPTDSEPRIARGAPGQVTFESVNACERVPGEAVAKAVGGRLLDVRPVNIKNFAPARCVYSVDIGGTKRAFVVWLNPADDFPGLRDAAEGPVKPVQGVGDDAYLTFDKDSKRYWLRAVKKGKVTIQISGDQSDWVEAIARVVLMSF